MKIALIGAQGCGKSTLGLEFCQVFPQYTFAATSVSAIMADRGMDPAKDVPIAERLVMQDIILGELDAFYSRFRDHTVFDRSPLDAAAYMLADVQRENVQPPVQGLVKRYVEKCIEVTNRHFQMLLFVPSVLGTPAEPREGKAPSGEAYVEHISLLINGLRHDERVQVRSFALPRRHVDIDKRVKGLRWSEQRLLRNSQDEREARLDAGVYEH